MQRGRREERYARLGDEDLISLVGSDDPRAFAALSTIATPAPPTGWPTA